MSRRRARVNELTVIYWRDIPAQVTASVGGRIHKELLEPRFQVAIDRAATVAGLTETSAYVAQWRRVSQPLDPTAAGEQAATDAAATINTDYHRDRLEGLVATGGVEPNHPEPNGSEPTSRQG